MGKRSVLACFIALVLIIVCFLFFLLARRADEPVCRELREGEIRPVLKGITGRELPGENVEALRGILYSYRGVESLFVAFQTGRESHAQILDAFGGPDVVTREFPVAGKYLFKGDMLGFYRGYEYQQKLGVDLFDRGLCEKIKLDELERAATGQYPEDAVAGYHLEFNASPGLGFYRVLVFKERGLVYVCVDKSPEGGVYWR